MAKIGIDCRFWSEAGVGRYIRNLIWEISKLDKTNTYYLLLLKKDLGISLPENFHKIEADIRWYTLSEQKDVLKILNSLKLDLVHFPHFNIPIFYRGKYVVTIHDLIHKHFAMKRASSHGALIYNFKKIAYDLTFNTAIKKSQKIISVSEYVKKELIGDHQIDPSKITVTYEAVEESFLEKVKETSKVDQQKVLQKFKIEKPFIFYVGNAHPHKNVEGLIKGFLALRGKGKGGSNLQLVLAGHDHYFWERIKKEYKDESIIYTGYITDEELISLYKSAKVYVFPSFEEGFGLPLLEAMACGVPVASSNKGSLPEVGGDAAVYFDPYDQGDMVSKISEVLNSEKLQKELVKKGEQRVKEFSFTKMAEETLKMYQLTLGN